jgi:uncharacterized protein (TIGR03435 family)
MRTHAFALAVLTATATLAQPPTPKPSFEVASIRPASGKPAPGTQGLGLMRGGPGSPDPERLTGNSVNLRILLQRAYGLQPFQIIGPDWVATALYDVAAKVPPGATKDDFNRMLQNLLEDRFKMKLHHETRDFPSYDLVIAKGGLKLKDAVSTDAGIAKAAPDASGGIITTRPPKDGSGFITTGRGAKLAGLANMLQNQLKGSVVTDHTGLTDTYDFHFEFSPPDVGTTGDFSAPSIFTALEKELGLKLEATKTQLDCIVIDHIEQPSEN